MAEPMEDTYDAIHHEEAASTNIKIPAGSQIPFQILTEYRTRREGGRIFHLWIGNVETLLTQREAKKLADHILKVIKEK